MPLEQRLPLELLADDEHLEVRLRALGDVVHVRLVQHLQVFGQEGRGELVADAVLDGMRMGRGHLPDRGEEGRGTQK